jgi:hypothetical protein
VQGPQGKCTNAGLILKFFIFFLKKKTCPRDPRPVVVGLHGGDPAIGLVEPPHTDQRGG